MLYLGQLHGAQYLELFLAAAKGVLARGQEPTFLIVGGGERFGELFQVAENMGVGHRIIFTGAVDHNVIPEYIAAADVAVACFADTPQVRTKSPLKICEYMASGKAIVASEVGEVPKMIGDAGVLVPPGDAEALADGIVRLLGDAELRRRLGERGRQRAETEYNWGVTAERTLRAYEMIVDESRWLNWKLDRSAASKGPFLVNPSGPPRAIPSSKLPKPTVKAPEPRVSAAPVTPAPKSVPERANGGSRPAVSASSNEPPDEMLASSFEGETRTVDAGGGLTAVTYIPPKPRLAGIPEEPKTGYANGTNGRKNGTAGGNGAKAKTARPVPKDADKQTGNGRFVPFVVNPPKPPHYKLGPFEPVRQFVEGNLDIMGVLDGRVTFIGPHTVQFDPTDTCPNDCIACWCRSPLLLDKLMPLDEQRQKLDLQLLVDVLDDLHRMGTKEIYIAGGGEPMAYPKILDLCYEIKKRGMICNINTSFINVTPAIAAELARLKVDFMTVSVWAGTPETYVLTHPSKTEEHFWDLKEALTHLNEIKDVVPYIKTYHVLSNLNFHELKKMVDFAIDTRSESIEWTLVDTIPDRTDALLLADDQREWLYNEALAVRQWIVEDEKESRVQLFMFDQFLRRISGSHTTVGEHDRTIIDSMPCTVAWQFARVLANGNINGCLKSHRIPTGSLHKNSFTDIWTGDGQTEFRKKTNVYKNPIRGFPISATTPTPNAVAINPATTWAASRTCSTACAPCLRGKWRSSRERNCGCAPRASTSRGETPRPDERLSLS
ncbi:MAG: glycosyltransferase [Deltaproteobacteria bacterium]|nr:glycosyltransferase [Deltaproteobacteria bacterium]